MIAVDTNVLLRYLFHADDPAQGALAVALIDGTHEREEAVFVPVIVLCELVWTLKTAFGLQQEDLRATLERLLAHSATSEDDEDSIFVIENVEAVRRAVGDYGRGKADLADYLIGRIAEAAGATTTYTFDRGAARAATFKRLRRSAIE